MVVACERGKVKLFAVDITVFSDNAIIQDERSKLAALHKMCQQPLQD
jgi:hypothetical protein